MFVFKFIYKIDFIQNFKILNLTIKTFIILNLKFYFCCKIF